MSDRLEQWFKREILVHEEILMRFLARSWSNRSELPDLRQETYARVCEAAQRSRPHTPKAFLFSVARHIMVDRRRRERVVSIQAVREIDGPIDIVEERTPERCLDGHQELLRLALAFDRLPRQCRKVVWMRRVLDIPQKEVAARLGITVRTVETQVFKGMQLLAEYLRQSAPAQTDEQRTSGSNGERLVINVINGNEPAKLTTD